MLTICRQRAEMVTVWIEQSTNGLFSGLIGGRQSIELNLKLEVFMYEAQSGAAAGMGMWALLIIVGLYAYLAITMSKMAHKTGQSESAWWAWVPVLNTFLLFKMAGKPMWWFLLCMIPVVNIVVFAMLWMEVAKGCGQPPVWGVMVLIPFINLIALGIMAFSDGGNQIAPSAPTSPADQPRQPMNVG